MILILGILIIFIMIFLFLLLKSLNTAKLTNYIMTLICSAIVVFIIFDPEICLYFSINGAKLFFYNVFPYVFPFMVLCNIIIEYNGISIYSKFLGILCKPQKLPKEASIVIAISALCGYPLGAKYSSTLYEDNVINFASFERLINIASNAGPLFIVGAVGTSMLKDKFLGYILLISCYLSCIAMGILLPYNSCNKYNSYNAQKNKKIQNRNFGIVIKSSLENSLQVSLQLMGFIIIFSVIIGIIKSLPAFNAIQNTIVKAMILGCIEMTNGASIISSSQMIIETKMILLSFLMSFGGFCVISQIYSLIGKHKISPLKFILRKFFQGLLSSLICFIIMKLFYTERTSYTFNSAVSRHTYNFYVIFILIFILPFFIGKLRRLIDFF